MLVILSEHPYLVGMRRVGNLSSFLLPLVLSDLVGINFLPNADLCSFVVAVGSLAGGVINIFLRFCHGAISIVFVFLMSIDIDDFLSIYRI